MANNSSGATGADIQRDAACVACRELIVHGALKCVHCGTFQDLRRYLALSSTALALLVALISVLTVAVPTIMNALEAKNSDVNVEILPVKGGGTTIRLLVRNVGNRQAIFREVSFQVDKNKKEKSVALLIEGNVIPANSFSLKQITVDKDLPLPNEGTSATSAKQKCTISVEVQRFDGKMRSFTMTYDCRFNQ